MVTDNHMEERYDEENLPVVAIQEPSAPTNIPDIERDELQRRAERMVAQLSTTEGSKEMELIDALGNVGMQAQRNGSSQLDLLRVRVGDMMSQEKSGDNITSNLVDLRMTLGEIDLHKLNKPGAIRTVASVLPFVSLINPPIKVLQKIAIRYEPVSKQIELIESNLREGRMLLTRDNVELRQIYARLEEQRLSVQKNAYLGELLMAHLQELMEKTDDPAKTEKIRSALYDVSIRVQNLRVMDEVFGQFIVSIEMTRQNNTRLGQAIEQTLSVATNVVTVGLAIQAALARERQVMEANARTREFIGDLILSNASLIRRHTEEIGEVYDDPVIAVEKITEAHQELVEAIDYADKLKQQGITNSQETIAKLAQLTMEFQGLPSVSSQAKDPLSIEA